jgi:hypothetical protein
MCSSPNRPANSSSMESSLLFRSKIYYYFYYLFRIGIHQSSETPSLGFVTKFFSKICFSFFFKGPPGKNCSCLKRGTMNCKNTNFGLASMSPTNFYFNEVSTLLANYWPSAQILECRLPWVEVGYCYPKSTVDTFETKKRN